MKLWDLSVIDGLLTGRPVSTAYVAGKAANHYVVFLPKGVPASLNSGTGKFALRWIDVDTGEWGPRSEMPSGGILPMAAPGKVNWLAVLQKQ